MMKTLIGIAFLIISTCAQAQVVDVTKLNKDQRAEIIGAIEKIDGKSTAVVVRQEAQEWVKIGENMGDALIGLTTKLRVEVDEFSKTTVGKITIATVMFKIIGKDALDTIDFFIEKLVGGFLLLMSLIVLFKLPHASFWYHDVEYSHVPVLFGLTTRKVVSKRGMVEDDGVLVSTIIAAIMFAAGIAHLA